MASERDAIKEAVSKIEAGVMLLLEVGHPNVPSLLRRFAKDVEKLEQDQAPELPPSAKVIRLSDWMAVDAAAGT